MGKIGINWPIGSFSGWGVLGLNVARRLLNDGRHDPVPFHDLSALSEGSLETTHRERLTVNRAWIAEFAKQRPDHPVRAGFPVLHGLGNRLIGLRSTPLVYGAPDLGIVFLEDTTLTGKDVERGRRFARIAAGASWTAEILRRAGLTQVSVCPQGIDPAIFRPGPPRATATDRFIVFSGGKLEHRKGQDIVIAAFRLFHERHPDALLAAAWFNPWPTLTKSMERSPWNVGAPNLDAAGAVDVASWLRTNGLPDNAFRVVPALPNTAMSGLLRQADVALFPNRCEGGTNLVAMEALACGVPTILSANTGHLDLIADVPCHPLRQQDAVLPGAPDMGTDGWGESSVDEILDALERVYVDRAEARAIGLQAAERMRQAWNWDLRVNRMIEDLGVLGR
jgi:glycosyltransferase involved in cell wall biosynthesis